jgi:hypothetical protein
LLSFEAAPRLYQGTIVESLVKRGGLSGMSNMMTTKAANSCGNITAMSRKRKPSFTKVDAQKKKIWPRVLAPLGKAHCRSDHHKSGGSVT